MSWTGTEVLFFAENHSSILYVVGLSMMRSIGLMFGFMGFVWGMGHAFMVRAGVAIGFSLPIVFVNYPEIAELINTLTPLERSLYLIKEFTIGFAYGVISSIPFYILRFAGSYSDSYRGESDSGLTDPLGERTSTYGILYLVIGMLFYFSSGQLWVLMGDLYKSYDIWPIIKFFPSMSENTPLILLQVLDGMMQSALVVAAPIMLMIAIVDVALMVAAKLSRRFGFYELAFLGKNLITIIILPAFIYMMVLWHQDGEFYKIDGLAFLKQLIK